jgi:hypothetical protein
VALRPGLAGAGPLPTGRRSALANAAIRKEHCGPEEWSATARGNLRAKNRRGRHHGPFVLKNLLRTRGFTRYYRAAFVSSPRPYHSILHGPKQRGSAMNLPLQMRAVSRGPFRRSRIAGSAGRVLPSWLFICDPPMVACSCADNSVACCTSADSCNCNGPTGAEAGCTPKTRWPRSSDTPDRHPGGARGNGWFGSPIDCYDATGASDGCSGDLF